MSCIDSSHKQLKVQITRIAGKSTEAVYYCVAPRSPMFGAQL